MKILDFWSIKNTNFNVIQSVTKRLPHKRKYNRLLGPTKPQLQMLISAVS